MYDVNSKHADDFINHEEILETLAYADENSKNLELIDSADRKSSNEKRTFSPGSIRSSGLSGSGAKRTGNLQAWQNRSKRIFTETVSLCSRRSIFPTTVSTAVPTVLII